MAIPTKIEQTGRTIDTTTSGIEIIRTFDVEPYEAHVEVLRHLRGFVDQDGKRTPPAADPYIKNCYCVKARADQDHPDSMVSSETIDVPADIPQALAKKHHPLAGAKITAHYRPLITAWDGEEDNKFDFLDPTFVAGIRQIPWPDGLFVTADIWSGKKAVSVPAAAGLPLAVPISDVVIRRILVGEIPWDAINLAADAVNETSWPQRAKLQGQLPKFEPRTLKFENAEIRNMLDSEGNRWHEITNHFKWIKHRGSTVIDGRGNRERGAWITWNHVFLNPVLWGLQGETAWYEVWKSRQIIGDQGLLPIGLPGLALKAGRLKNEVNFDFLFGL